MPILRAVWLGQGGIQRLFGAFLSVTLLAPTLVFWGVYWALASSGSEALTFFALFLAPALIVLILLPLAVCLGVGSWRAAAPLGGLGSAIRWVIGTAFFWVPSAAFWVFEKISGLGWSLFGV